ncbi:MAG: response regulator [Candidatus Rokubacteria bacterium]|nr:response regulator [Candidatus Rokubacteria bacterium]
MEDRDFVVSVFLMEAWDTLAVVEDGLGRAEPPFDALRVVTHRLRGASALHGFPRVSAEATAMEEAVEALAEVPPEARRHVVGRVVEHVASLKRLFDAIGATGHEEPEDVFAYFGPEATEHLDTMTSALLALERDGHDEAQLATLFRAVHTLKGAAYTVGRRVIGDLAHQLEDVLMAVREARAPMTPALVEAGLVASDALKLLLRAADMDAAEVDQAAARAVAQLEGVALMLMPFEDAGSRAGAPLDGAGSRPYGTPAPETPALETPPSEGEAPRMSSVSPRPAEPRSARPSIRVNLERLDGLMSVVGELVIARGRLDRRVRELEQVGEHLVFSRSRMTQTVRDFEGKYQFPPLQEAGATPGFGELEFDRYDDFSILARRAAEISADVAEIQIQLVALIRTIRGDTAQIQRLTGELRQEVTRARLVPIGRLFARFTRQVREAARASGRRVALDVTGEAVEMDNAVIEEIADPLLHLVQNAIVHGIEDPDERRRLGKAEEGTVSLGASQRGGALYVEVADDGRGIDIAMVRQTAIARGIITPGAAAALPDRDALDLIFVPGVSTAATVTAASGRGVGMDVVRTNVSRLNGDIHIETEPGVGTRFTIKLPLTIAISDALVVRAGGELFAVPMAAVHTVLTVRPDAIRATDAGEMVLVEDQPVDLVHLSALLGLAAAERTPGLPVVVVRSGRRRLAIAVDAFVGKDEIVIKPLGRFLETVGPFAGATVSGNGRVVLLLDAARLLEVAGRAMPAPPMDDAGVSPAPRPTAASRRVLLVDDSISVRKFVGQMLTRAGFVVQTANDGTDALQQLAELAVDVVITDLEMPRVNGYELIRDLHRRPATRDVPVVVLTTRAGAKHAELARQLGVRHYVTKPVDERAFIRLLEDLVTTDGTGTRAHAAPFEGTGSRAVATPVPVAVAVPAPGPGPTERVP